MKITMNIVNSFFLFVSNRIPVVRSPVASSSVVSIPVVRSPVASSPVVRVPVYGGQMFFIFLSEPNIECFEAIMKMTSK